MTRHRILNVGLLALIVAGFAVTVDSTSSARTQAGCTFQLCPGDPIAVLIPAASNQPEPDPGPPTDLLVFTGRSLGTVNTVGCNPGNFPLQRAVLVDPDGGRAPRNLEVINVTLTTPIPPGTRFSDFAFEANCTAGGIAYKRYRATVN